MEFKYKKNHPLHYNLGNKVNTYKYCIKNNIDVPKMLYYGNFKELKINNIEKQSFVIKPICGCSSSGVYIIKYNNVLNYYTEIFSKKTYNEIKDFFNIVKKFYDNRYCFIEEYIEHTINGKNIPGIDYKVFCYNGIPKQVRIISRENEKLGGKIIVSLYCLKTFKKINLNEYYVKSKKLKFTDNNIVELKETKEELIKLANFSKSLLNKIEFNEGLISLDLYKVKEKYLLGEFTLTPGALYYPIINVKYLKEIFS